MPEFKPLELSSLDLDLENARLPESQKTQPGALFAIAKQQGPKMIALAKDIVSKGLDPLVNVAVIEDSLTGRYIVQEGNRRVATVMILETPGTVDGALEPKLQKTLKELSTKFNKNPITQIDCKVFREDEELEHWVRLRHTGQNEGAGLVEWGGNEKDRYNARRTGRSPAGQILDLMQNNGISVDGGNKRGGIITSLTRLISTPEVREKLGLDIRDGVVVSAFPESELVKGLGYVVEQLRTGKTKVRDIYTADQRRDFALKIPGNALPNSATKGTLILPIDGLGRPVAPRIPKKVRIRNKVESLDRKNLVPNSISWNIGNTRIKRILWELQTMSVENCTNACAVLLRVFVELSVDVTLSAKNWMSDADRRNKPLALRMKVLATELNKMGIIDADLLDAVENMADNQKFVLYASVPTFNKYVHNQYVHPKPTDLLRSWDELQPFMEKLWS